MSIQGEQIVARMPAPSSGSQLAKPSRERYPKPLIDHASDALSHQPAWGVSCAEAKRDGLSFRANGLRVVASLLRVVGDELLARAPSG